MENDGNKVKTAPQLSRRTFLGVALTPAVIHLSHLSGCGGSEIASGATSEEQQQIPLATTGTHASDISSLPAGAVLLGLYPGNGITAFQAAAPKLDFSWLKAGDSVLIKVAVNSQYPHPSTTCVNGVIAMIQELKRRGAGRVIVADQAGVEHVRSSAKGRVDSTQNMFRQNGLAAVTQYDAETCFFDDQPFATGYFRPTLPTAHHWPRGLYIPTIVNSVDHIVYMPRLGAHAIAGNTQAHKMAIGWLREDSRHDMHNDARYFYEKYTEVNYTKELAARIRLVVGVSEQALLHGGPDQGTPYAMNPVLVLASTSLSNHDAVGASLLVTLNRMVTKVSAGAQIYTAYSAPFLNLGLSNGITVPSGDAGAWVDSGSSFSTLNPHAWESGITKDRAITRGWALSGGKPTSIQVVRDGARLSTDIERGVVAHGEGLYLLA
jgi:uncharacterized protein (DUF362 family)